MTFRRLGMFLLLGLGALAGCHGNTMSEAASDAAEQQRLTSELESDRASLIFAQQEIELAQRRAKERLGGRDPVDSRPEHEAEQHLYFAQLTMHMVQDELQVQRDLQVWKRFVKASMKR